MKDYPVLVNAITNFLFLQKKNPKKNKNSSENLFIHLDLIILIAVPAGTYLFKVNNRNTSKISSK